MAVLRECSCSNPFCSCEYRFTSSETGFSRQSYWHYHAEITQAIAAGKYGRELQNRMRSPDSVYLSRSGEYAYCPHCDELHFGGRIAVYIHKKGKRAELEYDDWTDSYHLSGFNSEASYEGVLQIPTPCWKCGSSLVYFDRYENMKCPRCGSSMKYGSSRRHR